MHLLLIHQAFVTADEAGGTRHYEFARRVIRAGHRVTIVASNVNYLSGRRITKICGIRAEQNVDGIRVLRVHAYAPTRRSFFRRVVSFLSFMLTSAVAALGAGRSDLVMGTSPPIFQALSAWVVAALHRRVFLLEIRDLWPDFAIDIGVLRSPLLIRLSRGLEQFLYSRAAHLVVNSPAFRDFLIAKGVPDRKITVIPNGVDYELFTHPVDSSSVREQLKLDGKFVVTYAGALGLANDIDTILRAARHLRGDSMVHFLLVGDGNERERLERQAKALELANVTFTGVKPKSVIPAILAASDACVATLKNIPMFRMTYPNKVFDYMAAGRPTVLAIDGAIREVIRAAGGGVIVAPGDDRALADAVRFLAGHQPEAVAMGHSARAFVRENFHRETLARRFLELIERLATRDRPETA